MAMREVVKKKKFGVGGEPKEEGMKGEL